MPEAKVSPVLRSLARPVYLPTVAAGTAVGMLVPVLPLYLRSNGLSFSAVSSVLAAAGFGSILGALPSGALLARFGERKVLIGALVVLAGTVAALGLVTATLSLIAFRLGFGVGVVAIRLGVQARVTRTAAAGVRGRAMSYIGGSMRMAVFIGPLLGGVVLDLTSFETTFAVCGLITLFGLLGTAGPRQRVSAEASPDDRSVGLVSSVLDHGRPLLLAGFASALVMTAREGRYVVLPLMADDLGLGPTAVGALVAVGTGADLALFPLSGHLMDRYGRLFAMVPAFSLMAAGLVVLAAAESAAMVGLAGVVMGVGNGMSSGTLLTLGSDLAPRDSPGPFLAVMATAQDSGKVLGPLVVGVTADAFGLATSALVLAAILALAIAQLVFVVGETRDLLEDRTRT